MKVRNSKPQQQDRRLLDAFLKKKLSEGWRKVKKTIFVSDKPRENCNQQHFRCVEHGESRKGATLLRLILKHCY